MATANQLKTAYIASHLWRQGKTFAACMENPVLRDCLQRHARAIDTLMARRGEHRPKQEELHL